MCHFALPEISLCGLAHLHPDLGRSQPQVLPLVHQQRHPGRLLLGHWHLLLGAISPHLVLVKRGESYFYNYSLLLFTVPSFYRL